MRDDTWRVLATQALAGDPGAQAAISGSLAVADGLGDLAVDDPAVLGWAVEFRAGVLLPALLDAGCAGDE
jgi:hypothetical protein